jgi:hypothetical protein
MLKEINISRLFWLILMFLVISVIGYFVSFAYSEGDFENSGVIIGFIVSCVKWIFILIAFPIAFLVKFFPKSNPIFYFIIVIIDSIIYSLLIEMVLVKYHKHKIKKST